GLEETVDDLRRRSRPLVVNREAKLVADPPGGERDRCPYWRSLDRVQDEIVEGAPWLVRVVQRLSAIRLRAKGDTPCRGQSPRGCCESSMSRGKVTGARRGAGCSVAPRRR